MTEESTPVEESAEEVSEEVSSDTSSFLDSVEDQYRNDPSVSKFNSVNDLAKEHVNLQSLLGRKGVIIPTEDDGVEAWQRYRKDIGIPDDAASYTKTGFDRPQDAQWDEQFETSMTEAAHKLNLSDVQLSGLLNAYSQQMNESLEGISKSAEVNFENAQASLRKDWGSAYEAKLNVGINALDQITGGEPSALASIALADGSPLGNNPNFIKAMSEVGQAFQERGLVNGESGNTSAMSPSEAQQKLGEIMADESKSKILFSQEYHPAKESLIKERERLLLFAYPEE